MNAELTTFQRRQRQNIRNAYLVASLDELRRGQETQDAYGKSVLQEMIDACLAHGVDNHGKVPD